MHTHWVNYKMKVDTVFTSAWSESTFEAIKKSPRSSGLFEVYINCLHYQPVMSRKPLPMSAKERTVLTPAASSALNFSSAVLYRLR